METKLMNINRLKFNWQAFCVVFLLLVTSLLSGCRSTNITWSHPTKNLDEFSYSHYYCYEAAIVPHSSGVYGDKVIIRQYFKDWEYEKCMRDRGFQEARDNGQCKVVESKNIGGKVISYGIFCPKAISR